MPGAPSLLLLYHHEVRTARGHCNMAKAELHRPRHARVRPDGCRTHTTTHRHDHRLHEIIRPDSVAEEELVG